MKGFIKQNIARFQVYLICVSLNIFNNSSPGFSIFGMIYVEDTATSEKDRVLVSRLDYAP